MNNPIVEHKARALADYGLRQTSTGSCPRRLVKLPCLRTECWCTSRLNDHGRRYRTTHGDQPVVMWEPYSAYPEELVEVLATAAADGLQVKVTGSSPWNPGRTIALVFTAGGAA